MTSGVTVNDEEQIDDVWIVGHQRGVVPDRVRAPAYLGQPAACRSMASGHDRLPPEMGTVEPEQGSVTSYCPSGSAIGGI
jgi:hypothetical protein